MNKQEAIKTIDQDKIQVGRLTEITREGNASHRKIEMVDYVPLETVVSAITKINEQQKPVVPKFVAEWIGECERSGWHLQKALSRLDDDDKVGDWAYDENDDLIPEKIDKFARAWLDGYTVEQERLYTVEIPNPNLNAHTVLQKTEKGIVLVTVTNARWRGWKNSKLTESEIKQDFDFLWQFAREVEGQVEK